MNTHSPSRERASKQPHCATGWIILQNDLESGRHSLAVSVSDDEVATWK